MPDVQEVFRMVTQKVQQDPGARDRLSKKRRRHDRNRRAGAFVAVAVVAAITVGAVAVMQRSTEPQPGGQPSSVFPISDVLYSTTVDLETGVVTPLPSSIASLDARYYAFSPDGAKILFGGCCSSPNPLFMVNVDGSDLHEISPPGIDAFGAQWSADGTTIVYQARNAETLKFGDLVVLDVATGRETQITHLDQSRGWGWWFLFPSFTGDGSHVLYQLPRGGHGARNDAWDLWTVPVTGGTPSPSLLNAAWGGVGRNGTAGAGLRAYVANMRFSDFSGSQLRIADPDIVDASGGPPTSLVSGGAISWVRWSPAGDRISYVSDGMVYVVDVPSGAITEIGAGSNPEWVDDHTLAIASP